MRVLLEDGVMDFYIAKVTNNATYGTKDTSLTIMLISWAYS